MKYYLIAGEASGDLHGSNLMKSLLTKDPDAEFRFWGGEKMENVGGSMVHHYSQMAFMGFIEVIKNLGTILQLLKKCKTDILKFNPDVLILIDYPGFNLRIARWAKKNNLKVVYYITPQVWAWHKSRVHDLGKYTDLLLVILPFEKEFFQLHGYDTIYVGHPLIDAVKSFKKDDNFSASNQLSGNILALLPGSRKQEIKAMLPIMLEACRNLSYEIIIAGASSLPESLYQDIITKANLKTNPKLITGRTYDILSIAEMALVSSGTATLETAIFGVPQVVCYKGNIVSYTIARLLIDLKYISLVNLIANKPIVTELIQNNLTSEKIQEAIRKMITDKDLIKTEYHLLVEKLGQEGASSRAANHIINLVQSP